MAHAASLSVDSFSATAFGMSPAKPTFISRVVALVDLHLLDALLHVGEEEIARITAGARRVRHDADDHQGAGVVREVPGREVVVLLRRVLPALVVLDPSRAWSAGRPRRPLQRRSARPWTWGGHRRRRRSGHRRRRRCAHRRRRAAHRRRRRAALARRAPRGSRPRRSGTRSRDRASRRPPRDR